MYVSEPEKEPPAASLNRKTDYFICTLSRQERILSLYLFNDQNIPYKSILKSMRSQAAVQDFSPLCLLKLAVLFIPCNSSIQSDVCPLCRHRHHARMTSDLFIFQHSDSSFSHYDSDHRVPHGNDLDNIDYSTLSLGEQTPLLSPDVPETPSVAVCQCCLNPTQNATSHLRRVFGCCCQPIDRLIVTPQSLMPTSFSQDTILRRHLPPASLVICADCANAILCGSQTLAQSGHLIDVESEEVAGMYRNVRGRADLGRNSNVSLSVLLAHVGHSVGDYETDKDFKIILLPWDKAPGKKPSALRIYLQLSDMVTVWYDVLVKDVSVWRVC